MFVAQCERGDSNPHPLRGQILSLVRLPVPPLSQKRRMLASDSSPNRVFSGWTIESKRAVGEAAILPPAASEGVGSWALRQARRSFAPAPSSASANATAVPLFESCINAMTRCRVASRIQSYTGTAISPGPLGG